MQYYHNLEILRTHAKKTQKELSELLNTTQQQYSKYEKGKQELPIRHLITLADFYNVTTDEILNRKEIQRTITNDERYIIDLYSNLSEKRKGKAERYIEELTEQQKEETAKAKETA